MNFQKLKYAVTVAESGSFREAARRLYMAQSSLSTAIRELEAEYGVTLFSRTKRGVAITPEGSEFLRYAKRILRQVELLEQRYHGETPTRPLFSVSTEHFDFAAQAFAELMLEFDAGTWDFRLFERNTEAVLDDVAEAVSELGLISQLPDSERAIAQVLEQKKLMFEPLTTFQPRVLVGKHHPLAAKESVTPDDLAPYPVIDYRQITESAYAYDAAETAGPSLYVASDRATAFNWLSETDGYLVSPGIITSPFAVYIASIPLADAESGTIGLVTRTADTPSLIAKRYHYLLSANLSTWSEQQ